MSQFPPPTSPAVAQHQSLHDLPVRTSGLAIAALVFGVLGLLLGPLGLVALILGIIALTKINADKSLKGMGLAIAGVALGAVGMLGSCLLAGVMLPALGKARQQARIVVDAANLRTIGISLATYANSNKGWYPETDLNWTTRLNAVSPLPPNTLVTPIDGGPKGSEPSYLYFPPATANPAPRTVICITNPAIISRGKGNALCVDGSVGSLTKDDLERILAAVRSGTPMTLSLDGASASPATQNNP